MFQTYIKKNYKKCQNSSKEMKSLKLLIFMLWPLCIWMEDAGYVSVGVYSQTNPILKISDKESEPDTEYFTTPLANGGK